MKRRVGGEGELMVCSIATFYIQSFRYKMLFIHFLSQQTFFRAPRKVSSTRFWCFEGRGMETLWKFHILEKFFKFLIKNLFRIIQIFVK